MNSTNTVSVATKMGEIELCFQKSGLVSLLLKKSVIADNPVEELSGFQKIRESVLAQLQQYFLAATAFNHISLLPTGTVFQKSVWRELTKIPLGETRTYGEIAKKLNSSARAVGNACRKNPIQIIIPCHRVISATGIGGYAGETAGKQVSIKRWLLTHEGVQL